jgi:hypothetical protein
MLSEAEFDAETTTRRWLPPGKLAAVCLSIDDIHPSTSQDGYEAGGELQDGALGRLAELQRRHRRLKATLCVTPDWRLDSLVPDSVLLRHIPWLRDHVHLTRLRPAGSLRLDRHPGLAGYLNSLERCEIVPHGLTHCHVGQNFCVEFQEQSAERCAAIIEDALEIFHAANVRFAAGFVPPAWNASAALIEALERLNFQFLCSARDLHTEISRDAVTRGSGLRGVSLIYPQLIGRRGLVHMTCNFQATSRPDRAIDILLLGGVLHIKAHIFKSGGGHTMLDGLDELYCNYLDLLLQAITQQFGDRVWWAYLSEVAGRVRAVA